ncbi:MAG: VacJ family lipoprotein [Pseudomonadota bacterium]
MRGQIIAAFAVLTLSACATTDADVAAGDAADPFEGVNRVMFDVNNGLDRAVLEPVADGYRAVTNEAVRGGVSNFLNNLGEPVVLVNTVLQGKPGAAFDTASRFMLNTTVGVLGVFDPATAIGVPEHNEDFGQTLGKWGVPPGPYLVLPVIGPSNLRDSVGSGVDGFANPLNYGQGDTYVASRAAIGVTGAVSARERLDGAIEALNSQPEPYVALRRNYSQQREAAIRDGELEDDPFKDLPVFDDFVFGDEEG